MSENNLILILMATKFEANPFLNQLKMVKIETLPFLVFKNENIILIITGIGKSPAASAATYGILKYNPGKILNFGACGLLNNKFKNGDIVEINKIVESDRPKLVNGNDRFYHCKTLNLAPVCTIASQDKPAVLRQERLDLSKKADIIDMESAGIAQVLLLFKRNCYFIKIVTDGLEDNTDAKIVKNIEKERNNLFIYFKEKILTSSILNLD